MGNLLFGFFPYCSFPFSMGIARVFSGFVISFGCAISGRQMLHSENKKTNLPYG